MRTPLRQEVAMALSGAWRNPDAISKSSKSIDCSLSRSRPSRGKPLSVNSFTKVGLEAEATCVMGDDCSLPSMAAMASLSLVWESPRVVRTWSRKSVMSLACGGMTRLDGDQRPGEQYPPPSRK